MVRINQLPLGLEDLIYIVPHHVNLVLLPKCESEEQVQAVDEKITEILSEAELDYPVYIMPIIESALGVVKAFEIASASDRVAALAIGLEDYTADLGAPRTKEGRETYFARNQVVNAARAAGIQAIDSVFSDVGDIFKNIPISAIPSPNFLGSLLPIMQFAHPVKPSAKAIFLPSLEFSYLLIPVLNISGHIISISHPFLTG